MSIRSYASTPEIQPSPGDWEAAPLEIVMWYEDLPTGLRAKASVDRALRHRDALGEAAELEAWRLDSVAPGLGDIAPIQSALSADILVLAAHSMGALGLRVEDLVRQWLQLARICPTALVISLDAEWRAVMEADPILSGWRREAERCGVPVFLHFGEPFEINERIGIQELRERVRDLSILLQCIRQPSNSFLVSTGAE